MHGLEERRIFGHIVFRHSLLNPFSRLPGHFLWLMVQENVIARIEKCMPRTIVFLTYTGNINSSKALDEIRHFVDNLKHLTSKFRCSNFTTTSWHHCDFLCLGQWSSNFGGNLKHKRKKAHILHQYWSNRSTQCWQIVVFLSPKTILSFINW